MPLITAVNFGVYVFKYKSVPIALVMGICLIFAAVIAEKVLEGNKAKVFSVVSSGFICLIVFVFSFLVVFTSYFSAERLENFIV